MKGKGIGRTGKDFVALSLYSFSSSKIKHKVISVDKDGNILYDNCESVEKRIEQETHFETKVFRGQSVQKQFTLANYVST